jgi:hypothetical protein
MEKKLIGFMQKKKDWYINEATQMLDLAQTIKYAKPEVCNQHWGKPKKQLLYDLRNKTQFCFDQAFEISLQIERKLVDSTGGEENTKQEEEQKTNVDEKNYVLKPSFIPKEFKKN